MLLHELHDVIEKLSDREDFWILKKIDGELCIGWRIDFPFLEDRHEVS